VWAATYPETDDMETAVISAVSGTRVSIVGWPARMLGQTQAVEGSSREIREIRGRISLKLNTNATGSTILYAEPKAVVDTPPRRAD
jgi:hypothetical protein